MGLNPIVGVVLIDTLCSLLSTGSIQEIKKALKILKILLTETNASI